MILPIAIYLAVALPLQDDAAESVRPPFEFLRSTEDWSRFRPGDDASLLDRIKRIQLSDDDSIWVGFGARAEARFETWNDFAFGAPTPSSRPWGRDDHFLLTRVLLHGDLHVGDAFRLFVEGKSAQATDRALLGGRRALDLDTIALQQAFVDVSVPIAEGTLTLRPGRQALSFGAQRLVSALPWGNTLRTWDGVTAVWRGGGWAVTGLATAFAPVDKTEFNSVDEDTTLAGVYATRAPRDGGRGLDVYTLVNRRADVTVNGTNGDERRTTVGVRTWGPLSASTDLEVEAAQQSGNVGPGDVSAWMLAAEAGWRPGVERGPSRVWLGVDAASGDRVAGGDVETFHQLFPLGHAYLGYADFVGRQNVLDVSAGSTWRVSGSATLDVDVHWFRVLDRDDALYNAGGGPLRTGLSEHRVGTEVDVLLKWAVDARTKAYAGYSRFFAGPALETSGAARDVDFGYVGVGWSI